MPAAPAWYDSSDVALSAQFALSGLPAAPSSSVILHLWNNKGGVGASDLLAQVVPLFRIQGSGDEYQGASTVMAQDRFLEARITGGLGGLSLASGSWKRIGAASYLPLPTIGNNQGVVIEVRLDPTADAAVQAVEFTLATDDANGHVVGDGNTEATPDGIYLGIGDASFTVHIAGVNVVQDPGGPSGNISLGQEVWIGAGTPWIRRAQLMALPAAASAKKRYDLISLAPDGTLRRTAGTEKTPPLLDSDKPVLPDGDIPKAYVVRGDGTTTIVNSDITNIWAASLYAFTSSALTAQIGAGPYARVDNSLCRNPGAQPASLVASSTNYIWLLGPGLLTVTQTPAKPALSSRALLLWEADTDGAGVTAFRDRRFFIGQRFEQWWYEAYGEVSDDEGVLRWVYWRNHSNRAAFINPMAAFSMGVSSLGNGTSGALRYDVQVDYAKTDTWVSMFLAAADMPGFAYNSAALTAGGFLPDRFDIPPGCRVRTKPHQIPAGATVNPQDATLLMEFAR